MTFLETILVLLLAAILLLQFSRRLHLPYPSMLALAGIAVALIPGAPTIPIDPEAALALFIAPALMDSAFDFPIGTARKFWAPLLVYAVGGVIVTTILVAMLGVWFAGLPIAAAIVLGAIVAPPDAAAATAVLSGRAIPRSTDAILRGESLFNDASALLLFAGALAVQSSGHLNATIGFEIAIAVPGGILLGIASARLSEYLNRFVSGTLGGNLLQFVQTMLIWIAAERLHLSAVLAVVASAMTLSSGSGTGSASGSGARMRVQSYAVWSAVVFVLNVIAFLLMGMQARQIVGDMIGPDLWQAMEFAGAVVATVIVTRLVMAVGFNRLFTWQRRRSGLPAPASIGQSLLAGWSGMRGLVTLATAFALPHDFPQRNLVVLCAFAVVIATLVVQGLTLGPVVRLLGLERSADARGEMAVVRAELADAAIAALDGKPYVEAEPLRAFYRIERAGLGDDADEASLDRLRALAQKAVRAQREALERLRGDHRLNTDEYNALLEELDWRELTNLPEDGRRIEES